MAAPSQKAPLAGKPPFATDDDDATFDVPPVPRPPRQRVVQNADNRESTYNAYDQYFENPRDSGAAFGVGMGLMGEVSDSDDDDDDDDVRRPAPVLAGGKNRALYEAATRAQAPGESAPTLASGQGFFPSDIKNQRSPSPPGYTPQAVPTNIYEKPSPGPGMSIQIPPPASQASQQPLPQPLRSMARSPMPAPVPQHAHLSPARPVAAFMMPGAPSTPVPASPAPSHTTFLSYPASPHPLPPSSPITPLFAAPPAALQSASKVSFSKEEKMPIMRGNSEDALLVRSRPSKEAGARGQGDDFWRRFSMVAHQAEAKRHSAGNSSWLAKTQAGARRLSLWVWIIGIILLVAVGVGVALGVRASANKPAHQDPIAIGGGANQSMEAPTPHAVVASSTQHAPTTPKATAAALGARALTQAIMKQSTSSTEPSIGPSAIPGPSPSITPSPIAPHAVHRRRRDRHHQHVRRG